MAKAQFKIKNGANVVIEGSAEEVAELLKIFDHGKEDNIVSDSKNRPEASRPTIASLIGELIDGGFFKQPKELGAIKNALEENGYHYPVTTLSPKLLGLVKKRQLRRIRDKNRWTYVSQ